MNTTREGGIAGDQAASGKEGNTPKPSRIFGDRVSKAENRGPQREQGRVEIPAFLTRRPA